MRLTASYEVVERVVVRYLVDLLKYKNEKTVKEYLRKRKGHEEELNMYLLATLGYNRKTISEGIQSSIKEAEKAVAEFIELEFGIQIDPVNAVEHAKVIADYLNNHITKALVTIKPRVGIYEKLYHDILSLIAEQGRGLDEDELRELVMTILYASLEDGLDSGYTQSDGQTWKMDRYVNQIEKHIFQDVYLLAFGQLASYGVELVRVFSYSNPREACAALQASGIICIVPREKASKRARTYPNIYDAEHHYLEYGGHHGRDGNCRHSWHHIASTKDRSDILYDRLDTAQMNLHIQRKRYNDMLNNIIH